MLKAVTGERIAATGPTRAQATQQRLIQSTRNIRILASTVLVLLVAGIVAMAFLPWQQSARGTGRVIAYSPQQRIQEVLSPAKGVIVDVAAGVNEGGTVKKDDVLLEIQPSAANLEQQLMSSREDLRDKLDTALAKVEVYEANVEGYQAARDFAVQAAEELVKSAEAKLAAKQKSLPGYDAKRWQAERDFQRQQKLLAEGIKSPREVEKLKKDLEVAESEYETLLEEIRSAEKELANKIAEQQQKRTEAQTKVESARGMMQAALGEAASVRKELRDLEIKLGELERLVVRAPVTGIIHRLPVFVGGGQTVKEGDYLLTIVPDMKEKAVELAIDGNDLPLIHLGDEVRLQFEGWPALQFSGWPSVAVGTFSGQVAAIDPADDGTGRFRVVVTPEDEDSWPDDRYLRQGVRANGWVMLGVVSLGYEIWRQLNAFPPVLTDPPGEKSEQDAGLPKSRPKLPK